MAIDKSKLPAHVGIIMDGNGRWAKQRGLERSEGHKQGAETFRRICEYAADIGVPYLTFYAFSTENWSRPAGEVGVIMNLFRDFLHEAEERSEENEKKGWKIRFVGSRDGLDEDIVKLFERVESLSSDKHRTVVNLAVNYGGRLEILDAVRGIAAAAARGEISPDALTDIDIASRLTTAGQPDPDLIIRPSGEYRLSNFLIWQSAYSEFWFTDTLWPDFTERDFDEAMESYAKRSRRFGAV